VKPNFQEPRVVPQYAVHALPTLPGIWARRGSGRTPASRVQHSKHINDYEPVGFRCFARLFQYRPPPGNTHPESSGQGVRSLTAKSLRCRPWPGVVRSRPDPDPALWGSVECKYSLDVHGRTNVAGAWMRKSDQHAVSRWCLP